MYQVKWICFCFKISKVFVSWPISTMEIAPLQAPGSYTQWHSRPHGLYDPISFESEHLKLRSSPSSPISSFLFISCLSQCHFRSLPSTPQSSGSCVLCILSLVYLLDAFPPPPLQGLLWVSWYGTSSHLVSITTAARNSPCLLCPLQFKQQPLCVCSFEKCKL